jgi:hypothetical protein
VLIPGQEDVSGDVEWSASNDTLDVDGNKHATVSLDQDDSVTLTARYTDDRNILTRSVEFHRCANPDDPVEHYNIRLTIDNNKDLLTLKHDRFANLRTKYDDYGTVPFDDCRIEIKHETNTVWTTLAETADLLPWEATVAGIFDLRSVVTANNEPYESPEIQITVQFPNRAEILSDPDVTNRMWQAWTNTLAAATPTHYREEGYFITLDTASNEYGITAYSVGSNYVNGTIAAWDTAPGERPPDSISNPTPLDKPIYVVGWFHTHPPRFYCSTGKYVGPSPGDHAYSTNEFINLPGFAYDYIATEYEDDNPEKGVIPPRHPLESPATIYTIPPDRRPLP